jgi:hypothetical protein
VSVSVVTLVSTFCAKLAQKCIKHFQLTNIDVDINCQCLKMRDISLVVNIEDYKLLRERKGFSSSLGNCLDYFKSTGNITGAQEISIKYYKLEKEYNDDNSDLTDMFYYNIFGTNSTANRLYDCVEKSIGIQIELFLDRHTPSWMMKLTKMNKLDTGITFFKYWKKVIFYYADIIKDFFLVSRSWICGR